MNTCDALVGDTPPPRLQNYRNRQWSATLQKEQEGSGLRTLCPGSQNPPMKRRFTKKQDRLNLHPLCVHLGSATEHSFTKEENGPGLRLLCPRNWGPTTNSSFKRKRGWDRPGLTRRKNEVRVLLWVETESTDSEPRDYLASATLWVKEPRHRSFSTMLISFRAKEPYQFCCPYCISYFLLEKIN